MFNRRGVGVCKTFRRDSSPLQDIAGAWLFQGSVGNIDDLYFGILCRNIGNISKVAAE